ncbi:MAG: hypothetical protein LC640_09055 [Frankia sp.]|nr:hypothetical protein [Frankia sp.]
MIVHATMRCKCCLNIRPVWMEYDGRHFCSYSCAEAWGECIQGRHLIAAARAKRDAERRAA